MPHNDADGQETYDFSWYGSPSASDNHDVFPRVPDGIYKVTLTATGIDSLKINSLNAFVQADSGKMEFKEALSRAGSDTKMNDFAGDCVFFYNNGDSDVDLTCFDSDAKGSHVTARYKLHSKERIHSFRAEIRGSKYDRGPGTCQATSDRVDPFSYVVSLTCNGNTGWSVRQVRAHFSVIFEV